LLAALLIVTLVAGLAAAMVWRQARSVQIEAAERARAQADWVLQGALDWARLILREDARANQSEALDHLGEVWAVPLAEARLSTFLASDKDNSSDAGPEAYLSGQIEDAQSRYNLRNLLSTSNEALELRTVVRLFESAGISASLASQLKLSLRQAANAASTNASDAPLLPQRLEQLQWLGFTPAQIERLRPLATWLPVTTPVNLNTAPREVIAALFDNMDLASAERLLRARQSDPLRTLEQVRSLLPSGVTVSAERAALSTSYFEVRGRLRLDERVLEQRSLVQRRNLELLVLDRQRISPQPGE
jgi:general secretion pathway protein K